MYNVHLMRRYNVSELRKNLSRALDQVERGEEVVIERGGRRFRLKSERAARPPRGTGRVLTVLDPTLLDSGWTWTWSPDGLQFRVGRKRR